MKNIIKSTTFLAIIACWLWSTAFVGVKIGLTYHTPLQFAGVRFFISGILIFLYFGKPARYFAELKANLKFILKLSLIQTFIQYSLFYSGINLLPSSLAAMIIGSQPMFIALVAHFSFHNDKMTPLKTGSILIGVAGIAVITLGRSGVEMKGTLEWLGIALLLVNNLVAGYSNVLVSKHSQGISPAVISSTSLMIGGILLSVVSVPVEGIHLGPFPPKYWYALAWLSFLSAAAFTIWNSLLKRPGVKVSLLNVWKFLIPVSGAALSWLIMENEKPDTVSLTGMAIIALSLLSLNYANRRALKEKASS
ncbi:DMT family transporter [Maribellus sp. CM-23]|uniref:DMT family transporter n=1 Tax=Maribellus sp. CM-23 TaxID=2781026 RepID=UPI001F319438|nr:DMT family transporter [Maribellus sp. CM-23]MCE4565775.1 DMT family transporter [Maribellus sp. CM-23]